MFDRSAGTHDQIAEGADGSLLIDIAEIEYPTAGPQARVALDLDVIQQEVTGGVDNHRIAGIQRQR